MNLKDQAKMNINENREKEKKRKKGEQIKKEREKAEHEKLRKESEDIINERISSIILELTKESTENYVEIKECVGDWIKVDEVHYEIRKPGYWTQRTENKSNPSLQLSNGYQIDEKDIRKFCKKNGFRIKYRYKDTLENKSKKNIRYQGIKYNYYKFKTVYEMFFYSYIIKVK